jgi:hypothetical protein
MNKKPEITIGCVSNLWSRQMTFINKGDIEHGHKHNYDHLTLLAHGRLKVTVDGISTEFVSPHMIFISKDKQHELEALEDNTVAYCIHALRDADKSGDILDPGMIPKGVIPTNFESITPFPKGGRFGDEN